MNYAKIYEDLIARRRAQPVEGYVEEHHVVPRAEGGSDDPANLVKLPAREHYVAHMLLARIYDDAQMWGALWMMSKCLGKKRAYLVNSKIYDMARREFSRRHSEFMKRFAAQQWFRDKMSAAHKGKPPNNKGKPMSEEQKEKLRQANLGKKQSEETKRKRNAKLKGHPSYTAGMKWWNNGTEQILSREGPPGWQPGRIYKRKKAGG